MLLPLKLFSVKPEHAKIDRKKFNRRDEKRPQNHQINLCDIIFPFIDSEPAYLAQYQHALCKKLRKWPLCRQGGRIFRPRDQYQSCHQPSYRNSDRPIHCLFDYLSHRTVCYHSLSQRQKKKHQRSAQKRKGWLFSDVWIRDNLVDPLPYRLSADGAQNNGFLRIA